MNPVNSIRVSIYFALFATLTAGLVGLGQNSWNLPVLVCFCGVVSILYTDKLGWIRLPQWMVFIGMIGGAGFAISASLGDLAANQILAVGNLLVYVQLPLMFQKKTKRVYEHWGVFLLLELVVAALVNDNVLYGLLMLPVLALGCASLIELAHFASLLRHSESHSESISVWARLLRWLGREHAESKLNSGISLSVPRYLALTPRASGPSSVTLSRWSRGVLPIALSVLLFSAVYFFCLPRLNSESYDGAGWGAVRIGFHEQISLNRIGEMLQSDAPAFRISMRDNRANSNYRPNFPPYIRVTVSKRYYDGPNGGDWQAGDRDISLDPRIMQKLPSTTEIRPELATESDSVTVTIVEKSSFGPYVPILAPLAKSNNEHDFRVFCKDWSVTDARLVSRTSDQKRRYSFVTYAYNHGIESPLIPDIRDVLDDERSFPFAFESRPTQSYELLEFPGSLEPIIPVRDRILESNGGRPTGKLATASLLSDTLASGREYTYTLSLTRATDNKIDPIVDFLLHKKKGHCQYFASALAMMLRSLEIPSRIVVGFRPTEYNEIGKYFAVQQNHAHVWVEAYFMVDELKGRFPVLPAWCTHGAWVRFDPTPAGNGSNSGTAIKQQRGQTYDAMQDMWNELVMKMDKSKQSDLWSLFGESASDSYTGIWQSIRRTIEDLESSRLVGGVFSPSRWFSWRTAAIVIVVGTMVVLLNRLLPWWFPNWSISKKAKRQRAKTLSSRIDFYERACRLLKRYGIERLPHQTPREFLREAASRLEKKAISLDAEFLSSVFYQRRFGGLSKLNEDEQAQLDRLLQSLETNLRKQVRGAI